MTHVSSNCSREQRQNRTDASSRPKSNRPIRPDWDAIASVGLTVMFAAVAGGLLSVGRLGLHPVMYGLLLR